MDSSGSMIKPDEKTLNYIHRMWQKYGVEGNGMIDTSEARHFVNQCFSG